jgi:hypothetical protein
MFSVTALDAELRRLRRQLEDGTVRRHLAPGSAPFGSCS